MQIWILTITWFKPQIEIIYMQKTEAKEWQVMDEVKLFRVEPTINVEAQDGTGAPDTGECKTENKLETPNQ